MIRRGSHAVKQNVILFQAKGLSLDVVATRLKTFQILCIARAIQRARPLRENPFLTIPSQAQQKNGRERSQALICPCI